MNVAGWRGKSVLLKRTLALLLSVAMVFSLTPMMGGSVAKAEEKKLTKIEYNHINNNSLNYLTDRKATWYDGVDHLSCDFSKLNKEGDTLTLIFDDESREQYKFIENKGYVNVNDESDIINEEEVLFTSMIHARDNGASSYSFVRAKGDWHVGKDNEVLVVYDNHVAHTYFEIDSDVKAVDYEPVIPLTVVENMDGTMKTDAEGNEYYEYRAYWRINDNDQITVTYKNGETKKYKCIDAVDVKYIQNVQNKKDYIAIGMDDIISPIEWSNNQGEKHWQVGKDNTVYFSFGGVKQEMKVEVLKNNVKNISFQPAKAHKVIEGVDGDDYYDYDPDTEENIVWRKYDIPEFLEGDKLTVEYKDGTKREFVMTLLRDEEDDYEYSAFTDGETVLGYDDVRTSDNQSEVHWVKGKDNKYYVEYMNHKAAVDVEVVENTISSIKLIPKKGYYERVHNIDGWETSFYDDESGEEVPRFIYSAPQFKNGDVLQVTKTEEGTSKTTNYVYDGLYFVNENDKNDRFYDVEREIDSYDEQMDNPWELNKTYKLTVEYGGAKCEVDVKIIEDPIESISYAPKETPKVCSYDQRTDEDEDGKEYTEYNQFDSNIPLEGDVLTINYKDGSKEDYTFNYDKWEFISTDGEIISEGDISVYDDQYNNHWSPGKDNYEIVGYRGHTIKVKVFVAPEPDKETMDVIEAIKKLPGNITYEESDDDIIKEVADRFDKLSDNQKETISKWEIRRLDNAKALARATAEAKAKVDVDQITPSDIVADAAKVDSKLLKQIGSSAITTTGSTSKKTMTIGWKKVKNATNYRVWYRKAGAKEWSTVWSKGKTKLTIKKLKVGGMYEFKISAYTKKDDTWLKGKDSKFSYNYLQTVSGLKAKAKGKKKATVSWKKKKGTSGYEVLYSMKKNMSKAKKVTVKGYKKTKATIKKLKKGKKYFIKVRPYKKYKGKKYIGVLSKTKTVKAK